MLTAIFRHLLAFLFLYLLGDGVDYLIKDIEFHWMFSLCLGLTGVIGLDKRRWENTRKQTLNRDGYRCTRCGVVSRLEVHHKVELEHGGDPYSLKPSRSTQPQRLLIQVYFSGLGYRVIHTRGLFNIIPDLRTRPGFAQDVQGQGAHVFTQYKELL